MTLPCFLVSEPQFRAQLPQLNPNLSYKQLQPAFILAHELDLFPVLGDEAETTCTGLAQEPPVSTAQALQEKLLPYASWAILYRYLESQPGVKIDPQGLLSTAETGVQKVVSINRNALYSYVLRNRNLFRSRFLKWLEENRTNYPGLPPNTPCQPAAFGDTPTGSAHDA